MIVRNEADILEQAIQSTVGLADEVVILDTGSEDNTIDIAGALGAVTLINGDRMHKARSRNATMSVATGDWIVILDADEQIADPIGFRAFLEGTEARSVFIRLSYMDGDKPTLTFSQQRAWRRGAFEYKYRAHEVPIPTDGWGEIAYTDFVWEHRPPADRLWKSDYTLERLQMDVAENPLDSRPLFYLGRLHTNRKEWEQGRDTLLRYLDAPGRDQGDGWYNLAYCYNGLGDQDARIRALYQACASMTDRREYWCELASIYHQDGGDNIALGLLKCALEQPAPTHSYVRAGWYGAGIYDLTARCLWKLARYEEGLEYAIQAAELAPDDERIACNLLWFESATGDMDAFYALYGPDVHSNRPRHAAIAELVEGPVVLDVGCGTGDLLASLESCFTELHGTEISQVAIDMARERVPQATLYHQATLPPLTCNTIVMSQVLEHLSSEMEQAFIEAASRRLADNGLLIVTVPHNGSVPALDHKRDYTEESLRNLLSTIGEPVLHSWSGEQHRLLMTVRK
jgi:glycosyltransferase involved in cell wall biosynthesis/2-polyprenyl-3-methyl-5-hydroxy-6-metoxy-1,4-benzoquinol methylase